VEKALTTKNLLPTLFPQLIHTPKTMRFSHSPTGLMIMINYEMKNTCKKSLSKNYIASMGTHSTERKKSLP